MNEQLLDSNDFKPSGIISSNCKGSLVVAYCGEEDISVGAEGKGYIFSSEVIIEIIAICRAVIVIIPGGAVNLELEVCFQAVIIELGFHGVFIISHWSHGNAVCPVILEAYDSPYCGWNIGGIEGCGIVNNLNAGIGTSPSFGP